MTCCSHLVRHLNTTSRGFSSSLIVRRATVGGMSDQPHKPLPLPGLHVGSVGVSGCPFVAGTLGHLPTNEVDVGGHPPPGGEQGPQGGWVEPEYSPPSSCTPEQYERIARDLVQLALQGEGLPKLLRISFHTCAHWSASARDGGCNGGWQQWPSDGNNPANAGLPGTIAALQQYKETCGFPITWADLATLGGAVAAEAAGGPAIAWYPGRRDALGPGPTHPSYSARLPPGGLNAEGMSYYWTNLGMTNREAVVLNGGGHSMGGADADATGWDGTFTSFGDSWPTPSNLWFRELVGSGWQWEEVESTGRLQYVPMPGQAGIKYAAEDGTRVMRLPSDMALRSSSVYSYWVAAYALNCGAFERDFSQAMQRLHQLGAGQTWHPDTSYQWRGLQGSWEGFGPSIQPQSDTEDLPLDVDLGDSQQRAALYAQLGPLADPTTALRPTEGADGGAHAPAL